MSRFADPTLTTTVPLGKCQCPGTPHADGDEAVVQKELGASALGRIGMAGSNAVVLGDPFAYHRQIVVEAVLSWNLLWHEPDGENGERAVVPAPINAQAAALLDEPTLTAIASALNDHLEESPPNDSAAPSRASRQVRRSRTRTKSRTPTT